MIIVDSVHSNKIEIKSNSMDILADDGYPLYSIDLKKQGTLRISTNDDPFSIRPYAANVIELTKNKMDRRIVVLCKHRNKK